MSQEADMQDKASVTEPAAYIITEALAELRKHKYASATVWSGLNTGHPFNKDATPLYAHPPAKREDGETPPPESHWEGPQPCGIADPSTRDCPNMKEVGGGMDGERYRCAVCGKGYFLDYEEMK